MLKSGSRRKCGYRARLPLALWGAILLLVALAVILPFMQQANRSLEALADYDPYQSFKQQRQTSSKNNAMSNRVESFVYGLMASEDFPAQIQTQQLKGLLSESINPDADVKFPENDYDDDKIAVGILSQQPKSYFHRIQQAVDNDNLEERCERYGFPMNTSTTNRPQRRIFYGSLIAEEPWELFEIVAAETYGVFSGVVFVESNRTQNFNARLFRRKDKHRRKLQALFGTPQLEIRRYVNENATLEPLAREHRQRQEILRGWKDMGMTRDDVGYIADADETFSRDFLRAIQTCPYIEALDYEAHHCFNPKVKIAGFTRMFETSPECLTKSRTWYHPDMILGACIELIGDESMNPLAPRVRDYLRAPGHANNCETGKNYESSFGNIIGNKYPLWSAADFRRQCGGHNYDLKAPNYSRHTAYHFHNFFADFRATRRKYKTYGHPVKGALTKKLENIGDDLKMLVRCVQNWTDAPIDNNGKTAVTETQRWQREIGGLEATLPPWPIYFMDPDYRLRKHKEIGEKVQQDEARRYKRKRMHPREQKIDRLQDEAQEFKRQMWTKELAAKQIFDRLTKEAQESKEQMLAKQSKIEALKAKHLKVKHHG